MEEQELKLLWKQYDHKLETLLVLNKNNMEAIQKLNARSALQPVIRVKWAGIVLGFFWVLFLGLLMWRAAAWANIFFVVSVGLLFIIYFIALCIYISHVVLIYQFDNSGTVMEAQQKLATLQTSGLQVTRILFLTLPLYATWWISFDWVSAHPAVFCFIQVPAVLALTFLGIWLYKNIDDKNSHKRWFRLLFNNPEWTGVIKAKAFLEEISQYQKEA